MDMLNITAEQLSALSDGQLQGDAFVQAVMSACADEGALETWNTYHLIGDVLRAQDLSGRGGELAFARRVQARLQIEPLPVSNAENATYLIAVPADSVRADGVNAIKFNKPAANDAQMRWKLVAGVASFAAVAAIGWNLVGGGLGLSNNAPSLAQAPASEPVLQTSGQPGQYMLRDPRLDELLAAHRQAGGTSALQMPSGFLRSATFEPTGR